MSEHRHLYNSARWKRGRLAHLAAHPLCVLCRQAGLVTAATVVDHVRPHRGDEILFFDPGNWQSVCKPCHDGAKQQLEKRGGLIRGCDANGIPLDPAHPWRKAQGPGG